MSSDGPLPPSAPEPGPQGVPPYGAPAGPPGTPPPYGAPDPWPGATGPAPGYPGGYPAAAPGYGGPAGPAPDNYLVWAILATVLCCLPLGIVSIVYAAQVNDKWLRGDVAGAMDSSRKARQFAMWSAITSVVVTVGFLVVYFGFFAVLIGTGAATSP